MWQECCELFLWAYKICWFKVCLQPAAQLKSLKIDAPATPYSPVPISTQNLLGQIASLSSTHFAMANLIAVSKRATALCHNTTRAPTGSPRFLVKSISTHWSKTSGLLIKLPLLSGMPGIFQAAVRNNRRISQMSSKSFRDNCLQIT